MRKRFRGVPVILAIAWNLASCHSAAPRAAAPLPENQQVISEALKDLYVAAAAEPAQSPAQQKAILRMAQKASNGKELLLVMRAAIGVFPSRSGGDQSVEGQVRSLVAAKMMKLATLDQLIEYAVRYPVNPESARALVQRMFQLEGEDSDPAGWYGIRVAASHLKVSDLGRQAQARGDQLAGR